MIQRLTELNEQRTLIDAQICTQLDNIIETLGISPDSLFIDLMSLRNLTIFQVSLLELHLEKIRQIAENITKTIVYIEDHQSLYKELCTFRSVETALIHAIEQNRR